MDLRMKQAQDLILKLKTDSSNQKMKKPVQGSIDVKTFEDIFKNLIKAEEFIYKALPDHKLNLEDSTKFCNELIESRELIDKILSDFGVLKKVDLKEQIKGTSEKVLIVTGKNNYKKIINKLGIDVSRILVSNVPLKREDMLKINPKMPEAALKSIDTKIKHFKNDISRKIQSLNPDKIILLSEDDINGQLLSKRMKEEYSAESYLTNIKDLTEQDLLDIIK